MHALWCCGLRRQSRDSNTGNKISFTAIFRTSNTPVVDTTRNPQGFNTEPNSDSPCEQVSPFEGPVELCQLGDSNPEHDEIKSLNPGGRTSTFEGVKARIVKHLSQDSGPRRHSRVSIGHSDEELARRAEVRRLRQMRIQDELNKDVDNDGNSNRSHQSARYLSTLIDMGSPCSGPRDTLEFTFDDCALASPVTSSDLSSTRYMPAEDDNCQQDAQIQDVCFSRGRNSPLETQSNADEMLSQSRPIRGPLPQRRCVSMVSISPRPSSCQPGSPRLDRIIGLDNEFNIRHGSHAWDDQSTLGIWLIAQGMKLSDNSVFQSEHCPREGTSTRNIIRLSTDEMCGVDSILESSFSVPDRVTTTESRLPTHDEEAIEDPAQTVPMNEEQAEVVHLQYSQSAANVNTEVELSKEVVHNGSSNYPSGLPSFVPTPSGSESHGYVLSQRDLDNLELSPVHWCGNLSAGGDMRNSEGQSSYTTAKEQASSQEPEQKDVPGLLGNHISQSQQNKDELGCSRKKESQESSVCPDQDYHAITLPDRSNKLPVVTASQSLEVLKRLFPLNPTRLSFKNKIQQKLSHISKLGSRSNNSTARFARISNSDSHGANPYNKGRNRSNLATHNSCDAREPRHAQNRSSQPNRPHFAHNTD